MASCATLNFDIVVAPDNVELTWSGFNDSLPIFVIETINRIKAMKTADIKDIFEQKKEAML
jgi:secreted Zn-dependent insulinase-like peptidase